MILWLIALAGTHVAVLEDWGGGVDLIPDHAWQRLRTGSGTKGVRHYGWAMLAITADDTPTGRTTGTARC